MMQLIHIPDRILDDRQIPETEEIHLEKPELLDRRHRELRGNGTVRRPRHRHVLYERLSRNHDARRMHGAVARQSLEALTHIDDTTRLRILLIHLPQLRIHLQRLIERDVQLVRHLLRDQVTLRIRNIQYTTDIPDDTARRERTEGDDLRYAVLPVLPGHVLDDLLPALVLEIHIDIGHGDTLRIQETLEDEIVTHRVDVGDADAVRDEGARRRASARSHRDVMGLRIVHIIPDDQEVLDEAHAGDRVELIVETRPVLLAVRAVACPESILTELPEIARRVVALRHLVARHMVVSEFNAYIAALCDFMGVVEGFLRIREQRPHLLLGLDIELPARIAQPILVGNLLSGLETEQDIVRLRILLPGVVDIVRGDQRNPGLLM